MKEVKEFNAEEVKELVNRIVKVLVEYLDTFVPKTPGWSKHTIMGPVGKLLSLITSGRFENRDAIIGYVINVHRNTARSDYVPKEAIDKLNDALTLMQELRKKVSTRVWLRLLREIDYAVYKSRFEKLLAKTQEKQEGA